MIFSRHHIILIALCAPLSVFAQDTANFGGDFLVGDEQKTKTNIKPQTETLNILSCPVDIFKKAYQSVQPNAQALALIHLENEAISACAIRQEKVNEILKNEEKLRDLLKDLNQVEEVTTSTNDEDVNILPDNKKKPIVITTEIQEITEVTPNSSLLSEDVPENNSVEIKVVAEPIKKNIYLYEVEIAGHQYLGDQKNIWATLKRNDGEIFIIKAGDELAGEIKILEVTANDVVIEDATGNSNKLKHTKKSAPEIIFMDFSADTSTPISENNLESGDGK